MLIFALAVIACAAAGLSAAQRNDVSRAAEQHRSLEATLGELRGLFGDSVHFDSDQLAQIEHRFGLNDLRSDAELATDSGREVQSLHDTQGRIIGWLSWAPDRALTATMNWLWGGAGLFGILLALAAALALGATQRLTRSFHRNVDLVRKLTTQDPLTGLANRRVPLDRLDAIMAARRDGVVVFLLFDIDGFHDVNDMLGWAGGDTMLVNIVERPRVWLPDGALFGRNQDDEFAVVIGSGKAQTATELADWITAALAAPIFMDQMWQSSSAWASPRRRKTARPATN
jgi:diguanylate cyclase (GGDEF)-like protein